MKRSLKKEIMSDLTKILAENQKETLKTIDPTVKQSANNQNIDEFDSETEKLYPASTSTPIQSKATTSKHTPIRSRNSRLYGIRSNVVTNFLSLGT